MKLLLLFVADEAMLLRGISCTLLKLFTAAAGVGCGLGLGLVLVLSLDPPDPALGGVGTKLLVCSWLCLGLVLNLCLLFLLPRTLGLLVLVTELLAAPVPVSPPVAWKCAKLGELPAAGALGTGVGVTRGKDGRRVVTTGPRGVVTGRSCFRVCLTAAP